MPRSMTAALVLASIAATGCQPGGVRGRTVPALYEQHGAEISCIAVYRFRDMTGAAVAPKAREGAWRIESFPGAGTATRDAVVDILNCRERVKDLSEMDQRVLRDVEPPYRLKKWEDDPDRRYLTRAMDEESPADLSPDQVRLMARWTMATQIVVGEVRSLTADIMGYEGTNVAEETLVSPKGRGIVACVVRFVLYDARTGQPLLDRACPASATFKHADLKTTFDKASYAEACMSRLLLNAAWLFMGEVLPHYASNVHVKQEHVNKPGPYGPDTADRQDRYLYLHGR